MKSVLDAPVREELISRISSINANNKAQWGKMDVSQMLKHGAACDDMFLGKLPIKRVFIGRIIGKMILKQVLKDDKPFKKNSPTAKELKTISDSSNIELQKKEWISGIEQYATYNRQNFVHPFFGPMSKEQVGFLAYKHADHHLRQFGA